MLLDPLATLCPGFRKSVLFLNGHKPLLHPKFEVLWSGAYPVAFVDGFANIAFDSTDRDKYLPHFVTGDFDSIREDVRQYYCSKDPVQVIETPDQNHTDFTKCLLIVSEFIQKEQCDVHAIVGACMSGGRLDHELGLIHSLYLARKMTSLPVYLVSDCCVSLLLAAGDHEININPDLFGGHCGLIPIGQPVTTKTTGLRWNLDGRLLSFGDLVSTSNVPIDAVVKVSCDNFLLFTLDYKNETTT